MHIPGTDHVTHKDIFPDFQSILVPGFAFAMSASSLLFLCYVSVVAALAHYSGSELFALPGAQAGLASNAAQGTAADALRAIFEGAKIEIFFFISVVSFTAGKVLYRMGEKMPERASIKRLLENSSGTKFQRLKEFISGSPSNKIKDDILLNQWAFHFVPTAKDTEKEHQTTGSSASASSGSQALTNVAPQQSSGSGHPQPNSMEPGETPTNNPAIRPLAKPMTDSLDLSDRKLLGAEFPYSNMVNYFDTRGLKHLSQLVPWKPSTQTTGEPESKNFSQHFVRALRARLRYFAPEQCWRIDRVEAHIRMMSSTWYSARFLWRLSWLAIVSGVINLAVSINCLKIPVAMHLIAGCGCRPWLSPFWVKEATDHLLPVCLALSIGCASKFAQWRIEGFFHLQRVWGLVLFFETVYSAALDKGTKITEGFGLELDPKLKQNFL